MTKITSRPMGELNGTSVELYTLTNAQGAFAEISTLGGTIVSIHVPDRDGKIGDVTLGYDTV